MANTFPVSGNIEPETFPHLLVDLHRRGATGSLKVTGPHHPKALYFRGGRILFGSSNDPRDQLGAILIENGKISREQLDEVNVKVGPGNPLAKVLAESGFVNQRELGDAARVKVERILADVLAWDSGSFEFEDGVLPKGAVDLKLSTERLLLASVQRIPDRAFALRHVELRTVLEPDPEGEAALSEIRADVWPLLERLDGRRTLKDAIALTRLDEFEAAKTACALLFLGVVRKKDSTSGEELDLAREAQSGLGVSDEEAEPDAALPPSPAIPASAATFAFGAEEEAEQPAEAEQPLAFSEPSPVPALASEGAPAYRALAEPASDEPFLFPEAAPTLQFTQAAPTPAASAVEDEEIEAAPSYPPAESTGFEIASEAEISPLPEATVPEAPEPEVPPPAVAPPRSVPSDTLPGERQGLNLQPPSFAVSRPRPDSTAPSLPEIPVAPTPASRPSTADLAALDELLSASTRQSRPAERPRSERWEPQFRPRTAPPRRGPARPPAGGSSRSGVLLGAGAVVLLAAASGAYFFWRPLGALVRSPLTRTTATTLGTLPRAPEPTAAAPVASAAATAPLSTEVPNAGVAATPAVAASTPGTVATPPTTMARSAPTPTPRTVQNAPAGAASSPGEARALLRQGALPEAARAFATSLAGSRGSYSLQVLTACANETVQKAVSAAGGDELFILPVVLNGRPCFRICWGVYESRQSAESALATIPAYFRQGGKPRLSTLAELLP